MGIEDFGLGPAGFTAPRQADWLIAIRDRFDSDLLSLGFTELPDYERDTFLGGITENMAFMLDGVGQTGEAVYDARSVANSTGLQLSNLALIVGVTRDPATFSTTTLRLGGTDGTEITQGKIAQIGIDGTRWIITEDRTIGETTTGILDIAARSEEKGEFVAIIGAIDTIVTTVNGWDTVTNLAAADPGDVRETDSALRARRQRALQSGGATSTNAILSALLNLDIVISAVVIDNKTDTLAVIDGISVDPFAVAAVVTPDSLSTEQQETVVRAIFEKLGGGTATSGTTSADVTKRDGRTETIFFSFAVDSTVSVAWTLELETGFVIADVEDELKELIEDFFLTLAPGETVYPTPMIALAATVEGIRNVTTLLLEGGAAPVTHDADEQPVIGVQTVS